MLNTNLLKPTQLDGSFNLLDKKHSLVSQNEVTENKGKNTISQGLHEVANEFETIFLEMLLSAARKSELSDSILDTKDNDNFVQMFDRELAKSSSKSVDLGIAEAIIRQMSGNGP